MASDVWPLIHAERAALVADLEGLTPEQWATPSLCEGWSVLQVAAHNVSTAKTTPAGFFTGLLGAGLSFDKFAARGVTKESKGGAAGTLEGLRSVLSATKAPPGPKVSYLGEELIHGEDIRRPLGIKRDYPIDAVLKTLDFYKGSNLIVGTKKRITGVTLKATDADWSTGSGPLVEGPAISLLMAATGRKTVLDDLEGPGVDLLRGR